MHMKLHLRGLGIYFLCVFLYPLFASAKIFLWYCLFWTFFFPFERGAIFC